MNYFKAKLLFLGVSCIAMISNTNAQSTTNGNNFILPPGPKFLGYTNNGTSPLMFRTNNIDRMRLNGTQNAVIAGVTQNVDGFFGISPNGFFANNSPWAMLHLDGPNNTAGFNGDWRRWMRTGTFMRENSDAMYVGLKQEAGTNRSDAVINWSDDAFTNGGPDALRFIFTGTSDGNGGGSTNPRRASGLNGYEYMRMLPYPYASSINSQNTPIGHIGFGPLFGNTAANSPKARLHSHTEDWFENYFQLSNEQYTGMQYNDGFKVGIGGFQNSTTTSGHAYIYNQEERSILFSTNHVAPSAVNPGASDATNDFERMRISSNTTPTYIGNQFTFTSYNPANLPADLTRVSISHDPMQPLNRPLALFHLGYNTGNSLIPGQANGTDGWRSWMEVGTLVTRTTDHVFVGLKPIANGLNGFNRQDAVIAWGDDYNSAISAINTGPDKLRVIFTSPTTSQPFAGPGAMSTTEGLEFVRYVPFHNTSLNVNDPRTGFGDFNSLLPSGTIDPGNTIEINSIMNGYNAVADTSVTGSYVGSTGASGLRFRDLTSKSLVVTPDSINKIDSTKVLTVDTLGNVVLIKAKGAGNADNGLSTNGPGAGKIHLGQNVGAAGDPGKLLNNRQVPMYGKNIYFTGQDTISKAAIYVGYTGNDVDQGKLNVKTLAKNLNITTAAVKGINRSFYNGSPAPGIEAIGVLGISDTLQTQVRVNNIGVKGIARKWYPIGILGISTDNQSGAASVGVQGDATSTNGINIGGQFTSRTGTTNNIGTFGRSFNTTNQGIGVRGESQGGNNSYGGYFTAIGASQNIGVYAEGGGTTGGTPSPTSADLAGFFNGDVYISGNFGPSDQNLKENIDTITNALTIIKQLKPKSFDFKHTAYPSMHLPKGKQYGLIAQEVETILPALVTNNTQPAKRDSLGNVVIPAVSFKGLEYQQLIPFLIKAIQEQQTKIDSLTNKLSSKDSIQDARLTALENAINQCCSNNSARHSSTATLNQLDIELSDKDAIVLNQNVPNPFAEQTTITYNVPESVGKAQIIFYNSAGQIIQTVDVKTRGKGKVNVFAADLSSGLYHYTLVADGKVVDSKKMVRE